MTRRRDLHNAPDPLQELFASSTAALTPQQAEQLARPLPEPQRDSFQQTLKLRRRAGVSPESLHPVTRQAAPPVVREAKTPGGYFCDRADSWYFFADIDGVVVHIKENLDTTAHFTPAGEVFFAYRVDGRLHEGRADDIGDARRRIPAHVRAVVGPKDVPTIGTWIPIRIPEEAMPCPECGAVPGVPCLDDRGPLVNSATALIVGAPWQPEPHEEMMEWADCCYSRRVMYRDTFYAARAAPDHR